MSKKNKRVNLSPDFHISAPLIIPSRDDYYIPKGNGIYVKKLQSEPYKNFRENYESQISTLVKGDSKFPTIKDVFVFFVQYFNSNKKYHECDLDNMVKTDLDSFKKYCYQDDSQVKVLLLYKKICDERVKSNWSYASIKILNSDKDIHIVLDAGLERVITSYQEEISKIQKLQDRED